MTTEQPSHLPTMGPDRTFLPAGRSVTSAVMSDIP
jgi:hypothetical protein